MTPGDLAGVAGAVAAAVGGTVSTFEPADGPTAGVVVGGRHLVLVREHPRTYSLSLPGGPAWDCPDRAGAERLGPELAAATAAAPGGVSILDVVAATRGRLADWTLSHPGVAVPAEAWLHEHGPGTAGGSVGLFPIGGAVQVVVWAGDDHLEHLVGGVPDPQLDRWLDSALARQQAAAEAAAAEKARRDALPVPTVDEVLARLRAGEVVSTGGGRSYDSYRVDEHGVLLRYEFDEGWSQEVPATVESLARAIAADPNRFRPA